jgi:hypothetical protein
MKRAMIVLCAAAMVCFGVQVAYSDIPDTGGTFIFNFDENGHATYQLWNFDTNAYGPVQTTTGSIAVDGYLTYDLPAWVGAPGDVSILDPNGSLSDGLRFLEVQPTYGTGYQMEFYSLRGGGDLADTDFPSDWNDSNGGVPYVGAYERPDGTFTFDAGYGGGPALDNYYNGISGVPEPVGIVALLGLGGMGLIGLAWRRRKAA